MAHLQMDRETAERLYRKVVEHADAHSCSLADAVANSALDFDDKTDLRRYVRDEYGIYA